MNNLIKDAKKYQETCGFINPIICRYMKYSYNSNPLYIKFENGDGSTNSLNGFNKISK